MEIRLSFLGSSHVLCTFPVCCFLNKTFIRKQQGKIPSGMVYTTPTLHSKQVKTTQELGKGLPTKRG